MTKRSVFEEVGEKRAAPVAVAARAPARRAIALWLWLLAALVAAMVLVGGATRLTDSGLSITEWAPVMGIVPPLSDADRQRAFDAYRGTTEFQQQNAWMTLDDFMPLYWWEWGHRLLGRLIGLVWAVGLAGFLLARAVPRGWTGWLVLPGLLGAAQGAVGWWMVASGLVGRLDVAPYRLMLHLGIAFSIFALLVWLALRVRLDEVATLAARRRRVGRVMAWTGWLGALVFLQILAGALVAGLDAGRGYVDWPLMEGNFLPPEAFDLAPAWANVFENPALAQFDHRMVAYLLVARHGAVPLAGPHRPPRRPPLGPAHRRGGLRPGGDRHLHLDQRGAARPLADAPGRGAAGRLRRSFGPASPRPIHPSSASSVHSGGASRRGVSPTIPQDPDSPPPWHLPAAAGRATGAPSRAAPGPADPRCALLFQRRWTRRNAPSRPPVLRRRPTPRQIRTPP